MASKLILLEGLPCSGKTSGARYVASQLRGWHKDVRLFTDEASVNPVDLKNYAFLTPEQYREFPESDRVLFNGEKLEDPSGWLIPLIDLDESIAAELESYRFYGCQPWEIERKVILYRWKNFAAKAEKETAIYIFDGFFLESIVNEMMMWFDLSQTEIDGFMKELADIIRPLEPLIIYLESDQIEARIREVSAEHDYDWLRDLVAYYTGQRKSDEDNAPDLDACTLSLEARQTVELKLIAKLGLDRIILKNAHTDWVEAYNFIRARIYEKTTGKPSTDI